MLRDSDFVALVGLSGAGAFAGTASEIDKYSSHILLRHVRFEKCGINNDPGRAADACDLFLAHGDHILVEDSTFIHGGHTQLNGTGPYQIWRRITGNGNWQDVSATPHFTGNHAATWLTNCVRSECQGSAGGFFGPLVEDSIFFGGGTEPEHASHNELIQIPGLNPIVRGNFLVQRNTTQAFSFCGSSQIETTPTVRDALQHIYNNTTWGGNINSMNPNNTYGGGTHSYSPDLCSGIKIKNNLFQGIETGSQPGYPWAYAFAYPSASSDLGSWPNGWKGQEIFGNVFGAHPVAPTSHLEIRMFGQDGGAVPVTDGTDNNDDGDCNDTGDTGRWPDNVCGNRASALVWANGTTRAVADPVPSHPSVLRQELVLAPTAAYGIRDAWPLTTTTDSGTSATVLTLADARYFKDSWGFSYTWGGLHTEYGDCIAIGATASTAATSAQKTRITAINYATGVVTVSPAVNHVSGSPVWPATNNGDGTCGAVWDNRGAAQ